MSELHYFETDKTAIFILFINSIGLIRHHLDMVGVGGSNPLGRTKFLNKNSTLRVLFLFVLFVWKNFGKILEK